MFVLGYLSPLAIQHGRLMKPPPTQAPATGGWLHGIVAHMRAGVDYEVQNVKLGTDDITTKIQSAWFQFLLLVLIEMAHAPINVTAATHIYA